MKNQKELKNFSEKFIKELGLFVENNKAEAIENYGINQAEFQAVVSKVFYLLGRNHKELTKKAKIV